MTIVILKDGQEIYFNDVGIARAFALAVGGKVKA
jgi:hypothetical protein